MLSYENYEITEDVKINIDLARRNLVDSIYKQAMLEGVATTYSNTETIIKGGKVKDMSLVDVSKVINLKRSWEFIMNEGVMHPIVATRAPGNPATFVPTNVAALMAIGPGVICDMVSKSANSATVSHFLTSKT